MGQRVFPHLPYKTRKHTFFEKFPIRYCNSKDSDYIWLCNSFVENKSCYATHRNDLVKTSPTFRIRMKPIDNLQTQKFTKSFLVYWKKLNALSDDLQKNAKIQETGSLLHGKPVFGIICLTSLILFRKKDPVKRFLTLHISLKGSSFIWTLTTEGFCNTAC